jgi:hypothetical protein
MTVLGEVPQRHYPAALTDFLFCANRRVPEAVALCDAPPPDPDPDRRHPRPCLKETRTGFYVVATSCP